MLGLRYNPWGWKICGIMNLLKFVLVPIYVFGFIYVFVQLSKYVSWQEYCLNKLLVNVFLVMVILIYHLNSSPLFPCKCICLC